MRTLALFALIVLTLAALGCGNPLDDIEVKTADLTNVSWNSIAVIGGASWTSATLVLTDTADATHEIDVNVGGPVLGIIFDFSTSDTGGDDDLSCLFQSSASLIVPEGETRTGGEITGGYVGSHVGAHLVLGGEDHDLTNGSGVQLKGGAVNFGIGMIAAFEWLDISLR